MGWSIGYDTNWERDIGYGVPATCDHRGCGMDINRGLSHVCGGEPYGGNRGCGLYFCEKHLQFHAKLPQLCSRCSRRYYKPFVPTPDRREWIHHKLTDPSWEEWRKENPDEVRKLILLWQKIPISDIARLFYVPPQLLGDLERGTFSNIEQWNLEFGNFRGRR